MLRQGRVLLCVALGLAFASTPSRSPGERLPDDEIDRLVARERYVDAFARAVDLARDVAHRRGPLAPETIAALERAGTIAHAGGGVEIAERVLDKTLALRREMRERDPRELAESLLRRGRIAQVSDDRVLARTYIEQALELLEPRASRYPALYADALSARASWLRQDHLDAAIAEYERALAVRLADPQAAALEIADDLTWLGWSLLHRGRHSEALGRLGEAEALLSGAGFARHSLRAVAVSARADERAVEGDWAGAESLYRISTAIFEETRQGCFSGFARRKCPPHGYPALALALLHQGRGEEAFDVLERGRGRITAEFLELGRSGIVDPVGYASAARLRAERNAAEVEAEGADPERSVELLLVALDRHARVLEAEARDLERVERAEASVRRIQATLGATEAYVGWEEVTLADHHRATSGPTRHEVWAYVVRRDGLSWIPLVQEATVGTARPLEREIWRYLSMLHGAASWPLRVDRDPELEARGAELSRVLVEPLLLELDGVDRLFVELTDLVPFLPVESLVLADGTSLPERYAVSYVPSASSYLEWRNSGARPDSTSRPALAIADPRLPFARDEVQGVASLFPRATVLDGSEATRRNLAQLARSDRLRDYGVVHLATHMISPWHHERAALRVADGLVELSDIAAGWRLDADLVTLSGCRSMTGHDYPERGEYLGLPQALFAVGARAVVASLWEVDDEAAALLMRRFYENLARDPRSPAAALREARLWLRGFTDEQGGRPFEHPIYWSGFILLGAPDERSAAPVRP